MSKGCNRPLAEGQWWGFCGETDMGQTLPVLCTECGGEYKLMPQEEEKKALAFRDELRKEMLGGTAFTVSQGIYLTDWRDGVFEQLRSDEGKGKINQQTKT